MEKAYVFHESVRGHLHIQRGIPCQDSAASFASEDGRIYLAVVADGHGSGKCFRSAVGSRTVVSIAGNALKEFAESVLATGESESSFYETIFSDPRTRVQIIRRLTDTILARWYDEVCADYAAHPLTDEEQVKLLAEFKTQDAVNKILKRVPHIYGTTLMAALLLPKCLILLHQGDGRIEVVYADGSVDQPVPWDARCEGFKTTSVCDADAPESIRHCVLNPEEKTLAAVYLACDGVEDAYRDTYEGHTGTHQLMGGVHTFFKDLTCQIAQKTDEEFQAYLAEMLPQFSAFGKFSGAGSGDDVSVAGIVDRAVIPDLVPQFTRDVTRYDLEEKLFWKEDAIQSKTRKHGILQKRRKAARENVAEIRRRQSRQANAIIRLPGASDEAQLERELQDALAALEHAEQEYDQYDAVYQKLMDERQQILDEIRMSEESPRADAPEEGSPEEAPLKEGSPEEAPLKEDSPEEEPQEENLPEVDAPEEDFPEEAPREE